VKFKAIDFLILSYICGVKVFLYCLIALVLSTSMTPCCAPFELEPACSGVKKDSCCSKEKKTTDEPEKDCGICSPFFTCGSCTGFPVQAIEIFVPHSASNNSNVFADCFLNFPDDCFIDKWQPPKLV